MSMANRKNVTGKRALLVKEIGARVKDLDMGQLVKLAGALSGKRSGTYAFYTKIGKPFEADKQPRRADDGAPANQVLRGGGTGPLVSLEEGRRLIEAITVDDDSTDWAESELLGTVELSERIKVARGTIDNWRKAGKVIALRKGLRNYVYPIRQFDRRAPLPGLAQVAGHFTSPEAAWEWLVAPNAMTGGRAPIDMLGGGDQAVEEVVRAAEGALDFN